MDPHHFTHSDRSDRLYQGVPHGELGDAIVDVREEGGHPSEAPRTLHDHGGLTFTEQRPVLVVGDGTGIFVGNEPKVPELLQVFHGRNDHRVCPRALTGEHLAEALGP